MKLTQDIIDDVRNSASITEVIGHYIPLVKKGRGYTALCPFHDDHDPSLSISDDKQIYKCFVCGNGGNAFNFVMNYKKVSFPQAVKEVADIIGKHIDIDINNAPKRVDKNQKYYDLLNAYIEETNYLLTATNAGLKAKEYLKNRGIDEEVIEYFKIGYNPQDEFMYKYLHTNNYSDQDMLESNIVRMMDNGIKDIFYNRITFPIHDEYGNPIAFTARDFENKSDSKYINSTDGLLYIKGDHLFNYNRAKDLAKKLKQLYIVEGTMDVIAYHRADIDNVVAILGTALTSKQLDLIKKVTNNVVLSFDGDKAGQAANMKHGEVLLNNGFNVEVIDNFTGLDPDEIVNKYSKNALKDLTSKRISLIEFAIKYYKNIYNLENYADRKTMAQQVSVLINQLKDQQDKDNYANELYELTRINVLETSNVSKKEYNIERAKQENYYSKDGLTKAEYAILSMISSSKEALNIYQRDLGYLLDPINQKLAMLIIDEYRKTDKCSLNKLLDEVDDDAIKSLITTIATLDSLDSEYSKENMSSLINKVKTQMKMRKIENLKELISKSQVIDENKTNEYLVEYQSLLRELGGKK